MEKMKELPTKPVSDWTEDEIKEIWLDMFFWVAANRPEWLKEAIYRRKKAIA